MNDKRVAIVSGTRPEIIKLAPVHRALAAAGLVEVRWIHTGQHGTMADEMLKCFGIVPHERLVRRGSSL